MAAAMIAALPTLLVYVRGRQVLRARAHGRRGQRLEETTWAHSPSATSARPSARRRHPQGHRHRDRARRVPDPGRPFGLRQVDAAEHDRRAGHADHAASIHIGDRDVNDVPPEGPRHRDGVPELRALPEHERARRTSPSALEMRKVPKAERDDVGRSASPRCCRSSHLLDRKPGAALRRPAPARGDGPGAGARPASCSCSTSRCPTSTPSCASRCAPRSSCCTSARSTTTVYVTHDQVEAMTLGDRIAVMKDGMVQQFGTPRRHLRPPGRPASSPSFIGSPSMNMVAAQRSGRRRCGARHRRWR